MARIASLLLSDQDAFEGGVDMNFPPSIFRANDDVLSWRCILHPLNSSHSSIWFVVSGCYTLCLLGRGPVHLGVAVVKNSREACG